jgi:mannitol 2-dehydrogenase
MTFVQVATGIETSAQNCGFLIENASIQNCVITRETNQFSDLGGNKIPLSNSSLRLSEESLLPFNREEVQSGIVHFGLGAFAKSHFSTIIQDVLANGDLSWGITAVSIRSDRGIQISREQDNLYSVISQGAGENGKDKITTVGSIVDYLYGQEDHSRVLELLSSRETKLVSMTVTAGGYYLNPRQGEAHLLDLENQDIQHDLQRTEEAPKTVYGYIYTGLRTRMEQNLPPFTILPLDNLEDNGGKFQQTLIEFVSQKGDEKLIQWIKDNIEIPSTMVDRITPSFRAGSDSSSFSYYLGEYGDIIDRSPVFAEEHRELVIEKTSAKLPPFSNIPDVRIVDDARPYHHRKLYTLNLAHAFIGMAGEIDASTYFVHEFVKKPEVKQFLKTLFEQVGKALPLELQQEQTEYGDTLIDRLSNTYLRDVFERVGRDPTRKLTYAVNVVKDALDLGVSASDLTHIAFYAGLYDYLMRDCQENPSIKVKDSKQFPEPAIDSNDFQKLREYAYGVIKSQGVMNAIALYNRMSTKES